MNIFRSQLPTDEQTFMSGYSDYITQRGLANHGDIPMPFPTYDIYRVAAERGESIVIVEDPVQDIHTDPVFTPIPQPQPKSLVFRSREPSIPKLIFKRRPK